MIPSGGQSGTFNIFLKSVTYWPMLSKFRGGPVKKTTLYIVQHLGILISRSGTVDVEEFLLAMARFE